MSIAAAPARTSLTYSPGGTAWLEAAKIATGAKFKMPPGRAEGPVQVVDLFAGAGGLSTGFEILGRLFGLNRVVAAADIDPAFAATYEANLGIAPVLIDLGEVGNSAALTESFCAGLQVDDTQPLILVGGPPCQGFTAHRKRSWDSHDLRNELVEAYANIAVRLRPDIVVMENVPELLSEKYWKHFDYFRTAMTTAGYEVTAAIHNLAGYGVPQDRFRSIVIAARQRIGPPPALLMPIQYRTVRNAIGNLPRIQAGERWHDDQMHGCTKHRMTTMDVIRQVPRDGGNRPKGVGPACLQKVDGFRDVYGRLAWDRPSVTITGYARNPASGRFVHPDQDRGLSLREAALLQGFPDDFTFTGSNDSRYKQVGNAVPPRFAVALAGHLLSHLAGHVSPIPSPEGLTTPTRNSFSSSLTGLKRWRK